MRRDRPGIGQINYFGVNGNWTGVARLVRAAERI